MFFIFLFSSPINKKNIMLCIINISNIINISVKLLLTTDFNIKKLSRIFRKSKDLPSKNYNVRKDFILCIYCVSSFRKFIFFRLTFLINCKYICSMKNL